MKRKLDISVGVITKVKEYYVAKPIIAGMMKVDRLQYAEKYGDEIHVYYEDATKFDRFFVNGVELKLPKEGDPV